MKRIAVFLLALPVAANAVLIDLGDTTLNTRTSLEWLDVTETAGMSVNEVLASSLAAEGWSLATTDMFSELASSYVGTDPFELSSDPISLIRGGRALALLGCTLSVNTDLCDYAPTDSLDPITFAVLGALSDGNGDPSRAGFGSIVVRIEDSDATIMWDLFDDFYDFNRREPQVGSFLVRTFTVPEPSTLALFGIGLAGIGFARWRRMQ